MLNLIGRSAGVLLKQAIFSFCITSPFLVSTTAHAFVYESPIGQQYTSACAITASGGLSTSYAVALSTAGSDYGYCSSIAAVPGAWLSLVSSNALPMVAGTTGSAYWRVYEDSDYEIMRLTYRVASSSQVNLSLTRFADYGYMPTSSDLVFNSGGTWNFIHQASGVSQSFVSSDFFFRFNFNICTAAGLCLAPSPPPDSYFFNEGSELVPALDIQSVDPEPSAIPEPSTLSLMLLAMAAAGTAVFRRRQA